MTPGTRQPGGLAPLLRRIEDGQPALLADFTALCDSGGRLAGTDSERRACDLALANINAGLMVSSAHNAPS